MPDDIPVVPIGIDADAYAAGLYARRREAMPVPYVAVPGVERAKCHENVDRYVAANPGTQRVTGWVIMEPMAGCFWFLSHSVVRMADSKLIDISPSGDERLRLTFLPDGSPEFFALIERHIPQLQYLPIKPE